MFLDEHEPNGTLNMQVLNLTTWKKNTESETPPGRGNQFELNPPCKSNDSTIFCMGFFRKDILFYPRLPNTLWGGILTPKTYLKHLLRRYLLHQQFQKRLQYYFNGRRLTSRVHIVQEIRKIQSSYGSYGSIFVWGRFPHGVVSWRCILTIVFWCVFFEKRGFFLGLLLWVSPLAPRLLNIKLSLMKHPLIRQQT